MTYRDQLFCSHIEALMQDMAMWGIDPSEHTELIHARAINLVNGGKMFELTLEYQEKIE